MAFLGALPCVLAVYLSSDVTGVVAMLSGGPHVVERYSLDANGIVDVLIRDEDSGYERAYRLGKA